MSVIKAPATLVLHNIGLLATPTGYEAKKGEEQGELLMLENGFVAVCDGVISSVGTGEVPKDFMGEDTEVIDAKGRLVTPGLVDAHTHLVFGGWREKELPLKLKGTPYLDILRAGGGILSSVRSTRAASEEQLLQKGKKLLGEMLCHGTTTCEAKSGYGLSLKDEVKQMRVVRSLQTMQPVDLVSTLMAAHAVPEEYLETPEEYIRLIIEEIIPFTAKEKLAQYCDVFCETAVFTPQQSKKILLAAQKHGLKSKIHADEIDPIGGSQLAAEIGAISAEHLIHAPDEGLAMMQKAGTIAVLLPATSFYLGKAYARAREMIKLGIPVVVASDFNPGSTTNLSLQFPMNVACYQYRMTPQEVLTAVTLNAAAAIERADTVGSIEVGKRADMVIWDGENLDYIFYRYGINLVDTVIKNGKVVVKEKQIQ